MLGAPFLRLITMLRDMSTNEPPSYGDPLTPPPGGFPPAGGHPPAPGGYGGAPVANKKALWSMIVGIASLVFALFCGLLIVGSIVAIVLGFIARGEINRSHGTQTGSGQALTGIITGTVVVVLFIVAVIGLATGVVEYNFNVE